FVSIMPHELFQRDGTDLFCRVPIPMTSATLGGEVEVPLVGGGRATVKIPEGTPNAKQFRLKKKGMPQVHSSFHGDLIVEVKVETPVNLSKKQKDLLKQFAEEGNNNWSPESKGFLDRAKDFWDGLKD
ncbi:MAG: molecular chaperone DnaJ, partial [Sphingomonadales bacterium]|nr:molecular chaperone DnaJ [Sphingomonadales bacterium]